MTLQFSSVIVVNASTYSSLLSPCSVVAVEIALLLFVSTNPSAAQAPVKMQYSLPYQILMPNCIAIEGIIIYKVGLINERVIQSSRARIMRSVKERHRRNDRELFCVFR